MIGVEDNTVPWSFWLAEHSYQLRYWQSVCVPHVQQCAVGYAQLLWSSWHWPCAPRVALPSHCCPFGQHSVAVSGHPVEVKVALL